MNRVFPVLHKKSIVSQVNRLAFPETKKLYVKDFFYCIKDGKEKNCIQEKIYQKIHPSAHSHC